MMEKEAVDFEWIAGKSPIKSLECFGDSGCGIRGIQAICEDPAQSSPKFEADIDSKFESTLLIPAGLHTINMSIYHSSGTFINKIELIGTNSTATTNK